jgi:MoxR-like ATPase
VVREQLVRATVDDLRPVIEPGTLQSLRDAVRITYVADPALEYALAIVRATRDEPRVRIGASSRAAIALVRCAQARAVLYGRDYVVPDDVKMLAAPVLAHRLALAARPNSPDQAEHLVNEIVERVAVPLRP